MNQDQINQLFHEWESKGDETARHLLWKWRLEKDWGSRDMLQNKILSYIKEKENEQRT